MKHSCKDQAGAVVGPRFVALICGAIGALTLAACSGGQDSPAPGAQNTAGTPGVVGPNVTPNDMNMDGMPVVENPPVGVDPATLDPGFILARRLNNTEFNNTVRDLLGTLQRPGDLVQATTVSGFDTNASALSGINTAIATSLWQAAQALVEEVFANPAQLAQVTSCADASCVQSFVETFGLRAFRRPLDATETTRFVGLYNTATTTLGLDHTGALQHLVKIMLLSPHFLYRLEADPDVAGAVAAKRPLNGYELASRLSYTLWSSMPDATLLQLAGTGELLEPTTMQAQVDRMLQDAKGSAFLSDFFGQWFSIRQLGSHSADADLYPAWSPELRAAMVADANAFFGKFVTGGQSWSALLSAPLDTTNAALADVYSADPPGSRAGFLGLPGFLTLTSRAERTAPTFRGRVALEAALCTKIEVPANLDIPELEEAGGEQVEVTNVREKLQVHRENPQCATCHEILDPIGLGLENYDAIGKYRTTYENGDTIDASGELMGTPFNGLSQLSTILAGDARLGPCPSKMLLSFSMARILRSTDDPYVAQMTT
ncbi:MAG TPA: DUF1592 domain-containing protein, partial [Polyangiaceae bacterium]|nr:DUF1592 domain-containing protein [Polyangiaceae bacterium]